MRRAGSADRAPAIQPGHLHLLGGAGVFWQDEDDLEQRVAAQVALGLELLDQLLERQVLVGEGAERRLAHPRQQLAERGARRRGRRAAPGC